MSDIDELERRTLGAAREHLEPEPGDARRIQLLLQARLLDGGQGAGPDPTSLAPNTALPASLAWTKVAAAVALSGALGGSIGFGAGYVVGQGAATSPAALEASPTPPKPLGADAPEPDPERPELIPTEPTPIDEPTPSESTLSESTRSAGAHLAAPIAPAPQARSTTDSTPLQKDAPSKDGASSAPSSTSPPSMFRDDQPASPQPSDPAYEELSMLRRAERAIRAGEPLLALGLLRELDERFPDGRLKEERAAARTMARCQRALDAEARSHAAAFDARYPHSVYGERVRALCKKDDDE